MNPHPLCYSATIALVFLSFLGHTTIAQDTWDGGGADDNWTTDLNWLDDTAPNPAATGGLIFDGAVRLTPNADSAFIGITSLEFAAGAGAFTLAGGDLSFTGGAAVTNNSANSQTIGNNLIVSDTSFTFDSASAALSLTGATIDNGGFTLTFQGANSITASSVISGTGNLVKDGAGTFTLSGVNTFTGTTTINGGMLQLDGDLDDASAVTINGMATLALGGDETLGSVAGAGGINLNANTLTTGDANDTTLSGVISGTGNLVKDGAGTFTLSGVNTFTGTTTINGGMLQLDGDLDDASAVTINGMATLALGGDETLGSVAGAGGINLNANTLTTGDANDTTLSGVISGTGNLIKQGAGTFTLSGTNTFTGTTTINGGMLQLDGDLDDASAVTINGMATLALGGDETLGSVAGAGGINLNANTLTTGDANDTTLSGVISGTGNLVKDGAGTFTLSGVNTFTGTTTINGGTLLLSSMASSVGGDVTVGNGTLQGIGTVQGNLIANAGGTVTPGNSIGTLNVGGNFNLNLNSTLDVEISKSGGGVITNDQVNVTGTATLASGSTINLTDLGGGGTFALGDTFTLIPTAAGVTDSGVAVNFADPFLSFETNINGNNLELVAVSAGVFENAATGANNKAIARALDQDAPAAAGDFQSYVNALNALGGGAPLDAALQQSSTLTVGAVFGADLSALQHHGTVHANYMSARRAGIAPAVQASAGENGPFQFASAASDPALLAWAINQQSAVALNEVESELSDSINTHAFIFGRFSDQDARTDRVGTQSDSVGVQFGMDKQINKDVLLGLLFVYDHSNVDFSSGGSADTDAIRVGPYASWTPMEHLFLDTSITYGFHRHDVDRTVAFAGFAGAPTSDFDAHDLSTYVGVSYEIPWGDHTVTPFASVQHTWYYSESFTETGGGGADLEVDSRDVHSLRSLLGVRLRSTCNVGGIKVVPEGFVGWGHEFLNDEDIDARFVGGSTTFTIDPSETKDDSIHYGVSAAALFSKTLSGHLQYEGETTEDGDIHVIKAGVTLRF